MTLFAWAAHHGVEQITEPREDVCPTPLSAGRKDKAAEDGKRPVAFWKDVYPVLEHSCLSCHGPKKQRGDFRVDRREDFFGKGDSPPLVVPGKSGESPLIAIVSGKKDIPGPHVHRLADGEVEILRAWIDAGALWPEPPSNAK
jgi:hypothetical protein